MEDEVVRRVMPHNTEAEKSVIGAMLLDAEAIGEAAEIVHAEDFYQKAYGVVFQSMLELEQEGKPVDLITLQDRLTQKDVPPEVSSLDFIRDALNTVPTSVNVRSYAQIVADNATLRRLIRLTEKISSDCYSAQQPLEDILEETESSVFHLLEDRGQKEYQPIRDLVIQALEKIEKASHQTSPITGLETGFTDLDRVLSGLQNADLILLAARPSMGKTAFALNIMQHAAFRNDKKVVFFSLEMSAPQLVNRLFSMESQIDAQNLRTGRLKPEDWTHLVEGSDVVGSSGIIIDDTPGLTVSRIRSKCRKYKLEHGLDLVIIDYLQLMSGNGRAESRQQEVSEISRSLKGLARELNVPVIALSQLSRQVEAREDHRPRLSDLRESGAIEQDADVVMFIYRDEVYNRDSEENKGQAEIIVAKQRNGPTDTVELIWIPEYTKFVNKEYAH